jgi:HEAT repeat protein
VAIALGKIGKDAVPALIQALQNGHNARVRSRTAMALGDIRSEDAVPVLVQALQGVCRSSERALRKIGTSEALKAVEEYQSRK